MRFISSTSLPLVAAIMAWTIACGDAAGPKTSTPAAVVLVSGDAQPAAEVGSKLSLPLTVRVTDSQGQKLSGVTVSWSTASGTLSASTSLTAGDGIATAEWTLGQLAGNQTATATVAGLKPITFSARAIAGPFTQIVLSRDTVRLLAAGDAFRLSARAADKYGNSVPQGTTVVSDDPSIVTADNFGSGAILTAQVSDKTTSISATAGSIVKTGTVIILPPPCRPGSGALSLAVGEVAVLSGAAASEFCLQGTPAGAEFTAIPYYSDLNGTLLRLSISTGNTTLGITSNRVAVPDFEVHARENVSQLRRDESFETSLRESSNAELVPLIPRARTARQQSAGRFSMSAAVPLVGDIVKLNTNSSTACANPYVRTGRVVSITDRAIVVADTANPANGFTTDDYRSFGAAFDTLVYPVDTLNFGTPTDVDKNNHVILFFTRAVNELTPPAQNFYVGGFFFSRDLFPTTSGGAVQV